MSHKIIICTIRDGFCTVCTIWGSSQQGEAWIISADFIIELWNLRYVQPPLKCFKGRWLGEPVGIKIKQFNKFQQTLYKTPQLATPPAPLQGSQSDFLLTFGLMWSSTATESSYIEPRRALRNVPFLILTLEYGTDSHRGNPIVFSKK